MKFWQLISIFRDEKKIIEDELQKEEWSFYFNIYKNFEFIVMQQQRALLDVQIDDVLLKSISSKSKKKIYGSIDNNIIYSYKNADTNKEISMSEAIEMFDHNAIEEAFEKSYSINKTSLP